MSYGSSLTLRVWRGIYSCRRYGGAPSAMILGDNIFWSWFTQDFQTADMEKLGATVFVYHVSDPKRYGVVDFDEDE